MLYGNRRFSEIAEAVGLSRTLLTTKWGDVYCRDGIATAEFQHRCGAILHVRADCAACGEEIQFKDLTVVGGTHPPQVRP